ncbi:MAG: hypothetical protein HN416_07215 [Nitrospina sp.]|jgi:hypothetical protein|nr:hypothetical protein [Nitrospina sp.]
MMVKKRSISFLVAGIIALAMTLAITNQSSAVVLGDGKVQINGFIKNWTGYRLGFYGEERGEGLSIFRTSIQLEADVQLSDDASLVAIYRVTREPEYHLEKDAVAAGVFGSDEMDENEFREYFLTWQATDRVWLAVGKQQVAWGDLAGIGLRVMDNVNALDVRWHYALDNFEDVRKPLNMLNMIFSLPSQEANLQFIWVPGLEDTVDRVNSVYITPAHRYGLNGGLFGLAEDGYIPIPAFEPQTSGNVMGIDRGLSDSAVGLRYQKTSGDLTWAVSDYYTHDMTAVNGEYHRQNILGITANYAGPWGGVWLFEGGYFENAHYAANDGSTAKADTFKYGLRRNANTFFYWLPHGDRRSVSSGMQIIQTYIPDNDAFANDSDAGVGGEETDTVCTLYLNFGVSNDRVQFNLNANHWLEREFGVTLLWIDYKPQIFGGNFLITPKLIYMYGNHSMSGDFGLMRGCTEALLELQYEF